MNPKHPLIASVLVLYASLKNMLSPITKMPILSITKITIIPWYHNQIVSIGMIHEILSL